MSMDCGRIVDQTGSGLGLMDIASYPKNDQSDPPSSNSSLLTSHNYESQGLTVLPPVSTFLYPSFRDQGSWWDRVDVKNIVNKDVNDCNCYGNDESEYNRSSSSPSALTSLPTSLSNSD